MFMSSEVCRIVKKNYDYGFSQLKRVVRGLALGRKKRKSRYFRQFLPRKQLDRQGSTPLTMHYVIRSVG